MQPRDMAAPSTPVARKGNVLVTLTPNPSPKAKGENLDPFYPIVDSAAWVGRLVGVGARLIQLRIKNKDEGRSRARRARRSPSAARPARR